MIGLNYFLLRGNDNVWVWGYGCVGVAVGALLLIPFCRRFPTIDRVITAAGAKIIIIALGGGLVYGGVAFIREHRLILEDDVRVMGVVTQVRRSWSEDECERWDYDGLVVYMDERGRRHEGRTTWSESEHPFVGMKVPVIYYRPNPDMAIVDPSWTTSVLPWCMLIVGFCLLIFALAPVRHVVKLTAWRKEGRQEPSQDRQAQQATNAEGRFRLACREVLADGKATVDEKRMLKMLAKRYEISNEAAKEIVRDEVRIFKQNRRSY